MRTNNQGSSNKWHWVKNIRCKGREIGVPIQILQWDILIGKYREFLQPSKMNI